MNISNFLEDELLNATLRNIPFSSPATVYGALLTALSGDADSVTEVTGTPYARQVIPFYAPVAGVAESSGVIDYPEATDDWGTIAHGGLYDAVVSGNLLYWGVVEVPRTIGSGETFRVPDKGWSVTLD